MNLNYKFIFILAICIVSQAAADLSALVTGLQQSLEDLKGTSDLNSNTKNVIDTAKKDLEGADLQEALAVINRVLDAISKDSNVPQFQKQAIEQLKTSLNALNDGSNVKSKITYLLLSLVVSLTVMVM